MIKRVQIAGLRGKSFDLATGPVTLVIGQNTAGKTTIADAIKWAMLGYIPGMSAPPRGWGDLLGNGLTQASVELELDGGKVTRSMRLEKGSVKMEEWAGHFAAVNVLALDPEKFFAASGPVKAQMVAEASGTAFDWKALVPDDLQNEGFKFALSWSSWVGLAIDTAKTNRSMAADQKKSYTATLRTLEGLRQIVIEDDTALKSKLDAGKEAVGKLREQIKAVNDQLTKALQPKGSDVQGKLDVIRRTLQNFMGRDHDAESYDQRCRDWQLDMGELKAISGTDVPKQGELEKLRVQQANLELETRLQEARLGELNGQIKALGDKYAKLRKLGCCPTCGTKGKSFASALKAAEETEQTAIMGAIQKADTGLRQAVEEFNRVKRRVGVGDGYWTKKDALDALKVELDAEGKLIELWKEHDRLVAEQQGQAQQMDTSSLQERKYDLECELADQQETNQGIEKELAEITFKRSQKRQLGMMEQQLEMAEKLWTASNLHVGQLEELRRRFTAMSLEPILATLAIFTDGIFAEPLSLEGHELGRMVGNRWVPLDQFSGAEIAVAMAAMTCALQPGNAQKNLVLADELSSFDDEHLAQFLVNVNDAVSAGLLEQFVGFSIPRKNLKALPKSVKVVTIK